MKIVFLTASPAAPEAVPAPAGHLAARHDVEIAGVFRAAAGTAAAPSDRVRIRRLAGRTAAVPRPAGDGDPGLADAELDVFLRTLDADVLVTATVALVPAVCDLAPARTLTVHRAGGADARLLARAPELDALAVPAEADRTWFEETLGAAAPRVVTLPDDEHAPGRWEALLAGLAALRDDDPRRQRDRADRAAFHRAANAPAADLPPHPPQPRPAPPEEPRPQVRDDLLAADACVENLRLAADALEAAGVPYVLLPGTGDTPRHRLAVDTGLRSRTCRALAGAYPGQAVHAVPLHPGDAAPAAPLPAELLTEAGPVRTLRIYRPYVTSGRTLHYGPEYGCDIEFRQRTPPGDAPAAVRRVHGRAFPAPAEYTDPPPVDAVCTCRASRSREELRYCLRSLAMYAPWIRRVFVVADDPPPPWLNTAHPRLTVTDRLRRADGLAAHVLPLTDDAFLGRALPAGRHTHPDVVYVDTADSRGLRRLDVLLADRDTDVFCLREGEDGDVPPTVRKLAVRSFLESYFPVPSPYERKRKGAPA